MAPLERPERVVTVGRNQQISLLNKAITLPQASTFAKERATEVTTKAMSSCGEVLRKASSARAVRRGTPEHTELLDLLDGMIVKLVRRAREAAKQAAKEFGQPTIANAFMLDKLYSRTSKSSEGTEANNTNGTGEGGTNNDTN